MANFIAVDFYKRSNGGGAPQAPPDNHSHQFLLIYLFFFLSFWTFNHKLFLVFLHSYSLLQTLLEWPGKLGQPHGRFCLVSYIWGCHTIFLLYHLYPIIYSSFYLRGEKIVYRAYMSTE